MRTPEFQLGWEDLRKIAIGAAVAAAGAALTYVSGWITGTNFGEWTPAVVAIWSVAANTIRKLLTNTTGATPE